MGRLLVQSARRLDGLTLADLDKLPRLDYHVASPRPACAPWSSWACVPTAPRSWWPSPTAIVSRPRAGADLLRDLRRRGMRAPMVAVGDGALGFWAALRAVWPETTEQRRWVHKVANCLNALPKSAQPTARRMLGEIRDAEDRRHAVAAIDAFAAFAAEFAVKWPKAVAKIVDDAEALLAFYDFPAEHWIHLKTTNPITACARSWPPATKPRPTLTVTPLKRSPPWSATGGRLSGGGRQPGAVSPGRLDHRVMVTRTGFVLSPVPSPLLKHTS